MALVGKDSGIRTKKFDNKKKKERNWKIAFIAFVIIILVGLPIYLARIEKFHIANIELKGNAVTTEEELRAIAEREISGSYLWVFPKSNAFLYPQDKLTKKLLEDIPRLASANVSLDGSRSLLIEVKEREPEAMYCREIEPEVFNDCYFLDDSGYIFSKAPSFSPGVYSVFGSDPVIENPSGSVYMLVNEFRNIRAFVEEVKTLSIGVSAFIKKDGEYQLLLIAGGVIMVKSEDDLAEVYSNLESFVKDDAFLGEKDALKRLSYIDLRFGKKIFYKFLEEQIFTAEPVPETETAPEPEIQPQPEPEQQIENSE